VRGRFQQNFSVVATEGPRKPESTAPACREELHERSDKDMAQGTGGTACTTIAQHNSLDELGMLAGVTDGNGSANGVAKQHNPWKMQLVDALREDLSVAGSAGGLGIRV
jgi:hypothetical protein